ncbi:NAD(P)H-binding protein [Nonomuraea sp. NPDC050404]|uniref:NmrA family NAD(P)-binding protein n=1 Tax=Nonomuraea sp. NPDC050404 TaxID=3155783 RepID=UPI0033D7B25D
MNEILVLGATGKTGRRVVSLLQAQGERVRPASRSSRLRFDWTAPETWREAVGAAEAVYLVAPDDPAPVRKFVQDATGVRRFVVLSGRGMDLVDNGFGAGMASAEKAVRDSGAEWTILRPNNFNQNFDEGLWHAPLRAGRLALPIGQVPEPFVDADDVAAVAAAALARDGHAGHVYDLAGPDRLTFASAVEVMARAAGRSIEYVELTPEQYRDELLAEGYPEAAVEALNAQFELHRAGISADPADGVRRALGRDPIAFADYAARVAATGAWS